MGSGGSRGSSGLSEILNQYKDKSVDLQNISPETNRVLGEYTNIFRDWFYSVSSVTWFWLVLAILLTILISLAAYLILKSWVKASLIAGVQLALSGQNADLGNSSMKGKAKIKNLVLYSLIWFGLTIPIDIVIIITLILSGKTIERNVILIVLILVLMILGVFNIMISIFAERLIVLNDFGPWRAWKKGITLVIGNFFTTIITGIINFIIAAIFGLVSLIGSVLVLGIPAFIVLFQSIKNGSMPGITAIIFLGILLLIFILAETLIGAIINVFKFSNWNQVFNSISKNEN